MIILKLQWILKIKENSINSKKDTINMFESSLINNKIVIIKVVIKNMIRP